MKENKAIILVLIITGILLIGCPNSIQNFTITFDKNDVGATGDMETQIIEEGTSANLLPCAFSKTGWTFQGWATTPSGAILYSDGDSYTMGNANAILYARWAPPSDYSLRDRGPAGGWIFYNKGSFSNGWQYLEAAPEDQISRAWGTYNFAVTGADDLSIGSGEQNTLDIIASDTAASNKAADECDSYSIVSQGVTFNDWFLPSYSELETMYDNLTAQGAGGLNTAAYYWSSTENDDANAWRHYFGNGNSYAGIKSVVSNVRAVRAF